ncbi:hypothetical protein BTH44_05045 [Streptococcus agalactiae]|nr:hypothetical protein BTH44_05045 [Streptococcus agalactiae]
MQHVNHSSFDKASKAGFIIALGIVYGDIGTSPLYTMQSLVNCAGCYWRCNLVFRWSFDASCNRNFSR